MLEDNLDIIYNKNYLVIVPKMTENLLDSFAYSFGNTVLMNNDNNTISRMANFINKNNFKQIILVDYQTEYEELISRLTKKHTIKSICTQALGALSSSFILTTFNGIYKMYENDKVESIAFLDKGFYETLKNKGENVSYIKLDIPKDDNKNIEIDYQSVGILNSQDNTKHSFYNELSAIRLNNKYIAKLNYKNKNTKKFIKLFGIKSEISTRNNLMNNNVNL